MIKGKATLLMLSLSIFTSSCTGQQHSNTTMSQDKSNLLCDTAQGICAMPGKENTSTTTVTNSKEAAVKIVYFTDPICSSCWGIEPQLKRLKAEYGHALEIEYRMGGLLPDWSYNSGGISKPSDVAHHWDEVSAYYQMPIDGDVWLEDPLDSSYPPSIAFKAAQLQNKKKALVFLRKIREMVFLEKKNITKWEHLSTAAIFAELDAKQLKEDMNSRAKLLFQQDLEYARQLGVRGFPTLFLSNQQQELSTLYGVKPYAEFEKQVKHLAPETTKTVFDRNWESLFNTYSSLTAKEFAVLSSISFQEAQQQLQTLTAKGQLLVYKTKNGSLWKRNTQ